MRFNPRFTCLWQWCHEMRAGWAAPTGQCPLASGHPLAQLCSQICAIHPTGWVCLIQEAERVTAQTGGIAKSHFTLDASQNMVSRIRSWWEAVSHIARDVRTTKFPKRRGLQQSNNHSYMHCKATCCNTYCSHHSKLPSWRFELCAESAQRVSHRSKPSELLPVVLGHRHPQRLTWDVDRLLYIAGYI